MKKISTLFTLLLLVLGLSARAQDVTFRLNLDMAAAVSVTVNDDVKTGLKDGMNEFDVERGSYVRVAAADGYRLMSVMEVEGDWSDECPIHAEDGLQFCDIMVFSDYGTIYYVTTAPAGDSRTALCTIDVDDASKVSVTRLSDESTLELTDGINEYTFDPERENRLRIVPTDKALYAVTLNDEAVAGNGYSYEVTVADGDRLSIEANYPDVKLPIHFTGSGDGYDQFITGVDVDGKPVFNWKDDNFTVPCGSVLEIYGNVREFEVTSFKVNGKAFSFSNPFGFIVDRETTIDIAVNRYASFDMTVEIDDPARAHVYKGYSYNGQEYTLQPGANTVEVLRTTPIISIVPADGCYLESVSIDGYNYDADELHTSPLLVGSLVNTSVLTITTGIIIRDIEATVIISHLEAAGGHLRLYRADGSEVELCEGSNTIAYYNGDNPFRLDTTGFEDEIFVYQDGKAIDMTYPGSRVYSLTLSPDVETVISVGEESGVGNVCVGSQSRSDIYTMQGIRIYGSPESLTPGLYIIGGRKVLVK